MKRPVTSGILGEGGGWWAQTKPLNLEALGSLPRAHGGPHFPVPLWPLRPALANELWAEGTWGPLELEHFVARGSPSRATSRVPDGPPGGAAGSARGDLRQWKALRPGAVCHGRETGPELPLSSPECSSGIALGVFVRGAHPHGQSRAPGSQPGLAAPLLCDVGEPPHPQCPHLQAGSVQV